MARWIWEPQSHRSEPNTSPVRHSEWTRTSTFSFPSTVPLTRATCVTLADLGLVGDDGEIAVCRREVRLRNPVHQALLVLAELDEIGDGGDLQPVLFREFVQVGAARHGAVIVQDLADDPGGLEAGQVRQVNDALGMPGADQDAAVARRQRENMPRFPEVLGLRGARR